MPYLPANCIRPPYITRLTALLGATTLAVSLFTVPAFAEGLDWTHTTTQQPHLIAQDITGGVLVAQADGASPHSSASPHGAGQRPGKVPGHGRPPLPTFINFETGANVKALAYADGNLWLGMPNGLIRYNVNSYDDHEIFTVASTRQTGPSGSDDPGKPGLLANGIYALDIAPNGALWISTYGGGLTRYTGTEWTTYTPVEGIGDRWVYDVEFDAKGRLWAATWKGLSVKEGDSFTTYTEADGLIDKWVYDIAIDKAGLIWAGTEGGISVFDGKTFTNYTHADGLGAEIPADQRKQVMDSNSRHHQSAGKANQGYNPNYVLSIAIDDDNIKWIGTWGAGLSRFDGKRWETFTTADGLGGNFVHALKFDNGGVLWAATDGGVSYLQEGHWNTITTANGLQNDNVFSMLFDDQGARWFGTWTGLSKMPAPPALPLKGGVSNPHGSMGKGPA